MVDDRNEPWQAARARQLVRYPLDHLDDWSIEFTVGSPDEVREGSTWLWDRRVVVYVRADWSPQKAANALAHELGHVHDARYLDARSRDDFMRQRGLSWSERYVSIKWPAFSKDEPRKAQRVGCEDFAEVFALRWGPAEPFQGTVRPPPTPESLAALERFLTPPGRPDGRGASHGDG